MVTGINYTYCGEPHGQCIEILNYVTHLKLI